MTPKQAWRMLGIAPTADKRAIKKAYAAKLKAIDPDKDPRAFLELREAFGRATDEAAWVEQENYETEIEAMEADFQPVVVDEDYPISSFNQDLISDNEAPGDYPPLPPQHSPNFSDDQVDNDDDDDTPYDGTDPELERNHPRNRLANMLWGDAPLTDAMQDEARALFTEIVSDPKMEEIDYGSQTEDWFGWMINQTMKRSDCVLPQAVEHFKWRDKQGGIHTPWFVEGIVSRARDLRRLQALQNPGHHEHAIYRRLSEPHEGPLTQIERFRFRNETLGFLRTMRHNFSTLEWDLNADAVELWQSSLEAQDAKIAATGSKGTSWWRIGFFIYLFLMVIGYVFDGDKPSAPQPSIRDQIIYPVYLKPPPDWVPIDEATKGMIRQLTVDDFAREQMKKNKAVKPIFTDDQRQLLLERTRKAIADATREAEKTLPPIQATPPLPTSNIDPELQKMTDEYVKLPQVTVQPTAPPPPVQSQIDEMSPDERKQLQEQVRKALEETKRQ